MKCYRKNGSDAGNRAGEEPDRVPSMKCYRKNGSDHPPNGGAVDVS